MKKCRNCEIEKEDNLFTDGVSICKQCVVSLKMEGMERFAAAGICRWCGLPLAGKKLSSKSKDQVGNYVHYDCDKNRDWLKACIIYNPDRVLHYASKRAQAVKYWAAQKAAAEAAKAEADRVAAEEKAAKDAAERAERERLEKEAAANAKEEAYARARREADQIVLSAEQVRIRDLEEQNRKLAAQAEKSMAAEKRAWYMFWKQKKV